MVIQTHLQALYGEEVSMEFKHWNSAEELREQESSLNERKLWVAFIERAVKDLLKKPRKNATKRHIKEIEKLRYTAQLFFFSNGEYYTRFRQKAFSFAGLNPEASLRHLRRKYLEMS
jgi:hypothetical protein